MNIECARKFLSYFGTPLVKFYDAERKLADPPKDLCSRFRSLDELFAMNNESPFPIHFLPNGNYWETNEKLKPIWCKYLSDTDPREGKKPRWNSFYLDIDWHPNTDKAFLEEYPTIDSWLEKYIPLFSGINLKPTFLARTPMGIHLHFVFDPKDRAAIGQAYTDEEMKSIILYVQKYVDGVEIGKWTKVNDPIRLPYSKHWKQDEPQTVKLYQFLGNSGKLELKEIKTLEDFDDEHMLFVRHHVLKELYKSVGQDHKAQKEADTFSKWLDQWPVKDVNIIPFPNLLQRLEKYPKEFEWRKYVFFLRWTSWWIRYLDTGACDLTSSYKRYKAENWFNCFYETKYWIEERPRWAVFPFLYHYFGKKRSLMKDFLLKEFEIDIFKSSLVADDLLWQIAKLDYSIYCDRNWVTITKEIVSKSWATSQASKVLFRTPFKVIGKAETNWQQWMWEAEERQSVFVLEKYWTNQRVIFISHPSKNEWNRRMASKQLFFYGDDNDLWMFLQALRDDPNIPVYDLNYLNWYYPDYVMLWPRHVKMIPWDEADNKVDMPLVTFTIIDPPTQITCSKYLKILCKCFDPVVAVPAFAMNLIAMWMNIWSEIPRGINIYPGLFLTWETGTGKSTMSDTIKHALWFRPKSRQVAANSVTGQPFKVDASDYCPLWMEEFTGEKITEKIQAEMRNVLNREVSKRWNLNSNTVFNLRAPLLVTWERIADFESLMNRFVTLSFDERQRIWTKTDLDEILNYWVLNDVLLTRHKWYKDLENLCTLYLESTKTLIAAWLKSRNADARAYVLVANYVFGLEQDETDLIEIIKSNLKSSWDDNESSNKDPFAKIENIFQEAMLERKVIATKISGKHGYTIKLMRHNSYFQKNKARLSKLKNDCNDMLDKFIKADSVKRKHYLEFEHPYITFDKNIMSFTVPDTQCSPLQKRMNAFNDNYLVLLWNNGYSQMSNDTPHGFWQTNTFSDAEDRE